MAPNSSIIALVALSSAGGLVLGFAPPAADVAPRRSWLSSPLAASSSSSSSSGTDASAAPLAAMDRRGALGSFAASAFATAVAVTANPGSAAAMGADKFASLMASYGVTDYKPAPDGFSSQAEFYGKAISGVDPLLITYNAPNGWLTVKPNIDNNGEDGTVSVGDYAKGDSAALFVSEKPLPAGATLEDRATVDALVYAAVTVKGGGTQVQGYKLGKVVKKLDAKTDSPYYVFDYSYTLITGAGFEINRKGVGSVCAVGNKNAQAFLGASTDIRFKKTEAQLREVVESFRCHAGLVPFP